MRLLNTHTLQLETFVGRDATPRYAILSHTWGDDEVLFEDVRQSANITAAASLSDQSRLRRKWWSLGSLRSSSLSGDGDDNSRRRRMQQHWLAFPRRVRRKAGFAKVVGACSRAARDGFDYIWIDTCCIDKSSSAELSEAINSMFKWYAQAEVCYAYLVDVDLEEVRAAAASAMQNGVGSTAAARKRPGAGRNRCTMGGDGGGGGGGPCPFKERLKASRWFTRGWTLQELVAPERVVFLARGWETVGERAELAPLLSQITGIDLAVLSRNGLHGNGGRTAGFAVATLGAKAVSVVADGNSAMTQEDSAIDRHKPGDKDSDAEADAAWEEPLACTHSFVHSNGSCTYCGIAVSLDAIMAGFSVATKMSWAASRRTTREEDAAYCLLGLFGIHMPLLYGEGGARAFLRLQEEIIKRGGGSSSSGPAARDGGGGGCDQSILASYGVGEFSLPFYQSNLFAMGPGAFAGGRYRVHAALRGAGPGHTPLMALTNQGLQVEMHVCPCTVRWTTVSGNQWDLVDLWLGVLDCSLDNDFLSRPAILLERLSDENWTFRRVGYNLLFKILPNMQKSAIDLVMEDGSNRRFEVSFNHEDISMRNICLLTSKEFGVSYVTPPLQIKLTEDSSYKLRASYPRNTGNYIPPIEVKARSYLYGAKEDNRRLSGVLCFDNGTTDGFFVAWGLVLTGRTDSDVSESTLSDSVTLQRRATKVPWCKILEWESMMGVKYQHDTAGRGRQFTDGELRVRLLNFQAPSREPKLTGSGVSVDERCSPVPVRARITSIDFLGRSALELDIEIDSFR